MKNLKIKARSNSQFLILNSSFEIIRNSKFVFSPTRLAPGRPHLLLWQYRVTKPIGLLLLCLAAAATAQDATPLHIGKITIDAVDVYSKHEARRASGQAF